MLDCLLALFAYKTLTSIKLAPREYEPSNRLKYPPTIEDSENCVCESKKARYYFCDCEDETCKHEIARRKAWDKYWLHLKKWHPKFKDK